MRLDKDKVEQELVLAQSDI
jgi:hypothetical protein